MLSPEKLRIILLLSLVATGYVLILTWNEDSQEQRQSHSRTPIEQIDPKTYAESNDFDLPISENSQDIPDQTLLLAEPEASLGSNQKGESDERSDSNRLVRIDTPKLQVWIDLLGGDIVRVNLPRYPRDIDRPEDPLFLLIKSSELDHYYVAQSGLIGPDGPDSKQTRPIYKTGQTYYKLSEGESLKLELRSSSAGVEVIKEFNFNADQYLVGVNHLVNNDTNNTFKAGLFAQIK